MRNKKENQDFIRCLKLGGALKYGKQKSKALQTIGAGVVVVALLPLFSLWLLPLGLWLIGEDLKLYAKTKQHDFKIWWRLFLR